MLGDKLNQAWDAGLEHFGDKIVKQPVPKIPMTLAEACSIAIPATYQPKINYIETYHLENILNDISDLSNKIESDIRELAMFPDKNQGLAMNKLSNIKLELSGIYQNLKNYTK